MSARSFYNGDKIFNLISERVNYNDNEYQSFLENDLIKRHLTFITLSEVFESSWIEWSSDYQNFSEELFDLVFDEYKDIFEEVDIISLANLIGSVGGSLGIFFGFAISGNIFAIYDIIVDKLFANVSK